MVFQPGQVLFDKRTDQPINRFVGPPLLERRKRHPALGLKSSQDLPLGGITLTDLASAPFLRRDKLHDPHGPSIGPGGQGCSNYQSPRRQIIVRDETCQFQHMAIEQRLGIHDRVNRLEVRRIDRRGSAEADNIPGYSARTKRDERSRTDLDLLLYGGWDGVRQYSPWRNGQGDVGEEALGSSDHGQDPNNTRDSRAHAGSPWFSGQFFSCAVLT